MCEILESVILVFRAKNITIPACARQSPFDGPSQGAMVPGL